MEGYLYSRKSLLATAFSTLFMFGGSAIFSDNSLESNGDFDAFNCSSPIGVTGRFPGC
jgi:hypothetical protein